MKASVKKFKGHKLCYADGNCAYFTTLPLSKQWGDDWNDRSAADNSGTPYEPCWHNEPKNLNSDYRGKAKKGQLCRCESCTRDWNRDGTPKFEVIKIFFDRAKVSDGVDIYSVEEINGNYSPWLVSLTFHNDGRQLRAGATVKEFKTFIKACGGKVYVEDK